MSASFDFAIDALAVQRVTRLVTKDEVTAGLRDRVALNGPDKLAYLVSCPFCVSVYAGAAASLARTVFPRAWRPLAYALALSAATSLKAEYDEKLDRGA